MQKIRKIIVMLLAAVLLAVCAAVLVGCAPEDEGDNTPPSGQTPTDKPGDNPGGEPGEEPGDNPSDGGTTYKIEAEDTFVDHIRGGATSGNPSGNEIIIENGSASNGRLVSYLYVNQQYLVFEFESDKAVTDATLTFALGTEYGITSLTDEQIQIFVNPTLNDSMSPYLDEEALSFDTLTWPTNGRIAEYEITDSMSLKEGKNEIYLKINNTDKDTIPALQGYSTMNALAPTVDYMSISADAKISFTTYDNY